MNHTMIWRVAIVVAAFAVALSAQAAVTNVIGTLELTEDRMLDLADGSVTVVSNLTGGAHALTVQGSGRLVVHRFSNPDARIAMDSGTTLEARCAAPAVCSKAFFHVDACAVDTLTYSSRSGFVTRWNDVRGSDYPYAHDYTSNVGVHNPFITPCHYNGRDVMDFGTIWQSGDGLLKGWGGTLQWSSTACTRPVEVFMAAGDTPDAKAGVDGTGTSHRNSSLFGSTVATGVRGNGAVGSTSELLFYGSLLHTDAKMSFTVDGVARAGNTYRLPDGMHVISCYATEPTYIDRTGMKDAPIAYFARERNNVFGGLRIGEYIVFTNELTSAERAEVNDYFDVKWRTEQKVASLSLADGASLALPDGMNLVVTGEYENAGATVTGPGRLTVDGSTHFPEFTLAGDMTIDVPAGATFIFDVLKGNGGLLTKTGEGTLLIGVNKAAKTKFSVSEGTLSVPPLDIPSCDDILAKACFHVDASEASSLTLNTVNGTNFVTRWNDVRGDGYPYATKPTDVASYPYIGTDETTGKTVVDFGTTWNKTTRADGYGAALVWNDFTGYRPMDIFIVERHNADMRQIIANGGSGTDYRNQALLGSTVAGNNTGFVPGNPASGHDSVPIYYFSARMNSIAAASCRIDAGDDDLSASQLLSYYPGYDQHVYGFYPTSSDYINGTDEIRFNHFASERGYVRGGQTLGEVVIFTNLLTAAQRDAMNMHLTMKWKPSEFEDLAQADVVVTDGTTWDTGWMNLMATNSLVLGGGTLNVKSLSAPASITLTEPATIGGALVLPDGEVDITFVGNEWMGLLKEGPVKVLGATSVSGSPRIVARFEPAQTPRRVTFRIGEDGIYASSRQGLEIIIR